ncbi:peptidoglycan-binding protein [Antiquaquibacter oligotrophicus]|uniref:peptidoglycan-binding domain-containing protein n=1 Tax=Antiquaquibacter oligotrophicus TaxID=2880260 RepID=UPI002AC97A51|nr:peptidoglycan-binding domain-containing protein [Antiquaquibacter oligotrophicus]UDF13036.1 peptidoglycan-binding protein [Antiquaquibacter oligotrophicus]
MAAPVTARRRAIQFAGAGAVVVAAIAFGWVLAAQFTSTAQRESAAQPPPPTPITVEVTRGDLTDSVSVSAEIVREHEDIVTVGGSDGRTVVTAQPVSNGGTAGAGAVVLEVGGRPVFLLPGAFPFYRDLVAGASGPDVSQLQNGLVAAGHPLTVDGKLGPETVAAVSALYRDAGYSPPTGDVPTPGATPSQGASAAATTQLSVPPEEFAVARSVPAIVISTTDVGVAPAEGAQIELSSGALIASATVPQAVAARLTAGTAGEAVLADGVAGMTVSALGEPDEETGESTVTFTPTGSIDDSLVGTSTTIRLDLEIAGRDSLIVPTRSVIAQGERDPAVSRLSPEGTFELVPVREIAALSGLSAVEPVEPGALDAGDKVRVDP